MLFSELKQTVEESVLALICPAYVELHFMVFFSAGFFLSFAEIDQFPFGRGTIENVRVASQSSCKNMCHLECSTTN